MDCNDKQIGRNIKAIRNANKKDYYEFATAINISEDLLKKIESGGRHATDQTIQKISEITGISFSSIKYKDLSYLEKGEFCLDEDLTFHELSEVDELKELNFRLLKLQFPIMEDKEALESDEFIAGIKIAHNSIETCDFTPKECIDAINHFIRSSDNPNCANLAAINILSCFGYLYTFTVISLVSEDKVPKLLKERITSLTDYWCAIRSSLSTKNIKNAKKDYLNKYNGYLTTYMRKLVESQEHADYAYYFLCVRYMIGLMDEDIIMLDENQMKIFGESLFDCLWKMGNKYAVALNNYINE